ncbi:VanZ family protein [Shewanella waksmanii]|uniref:VanZ family protein n=1 Tax=Shewanella waksmanii TaxID=213783 RepID=UPI0037355416
MLFQIKWLTRQRLFLLLTALLMAFILWAIYSANSGQSTIFSDLVKNVPFGDKVGHFALFGGLSLPLNLSLSMRVYRPLRCYWGTLIVGLFALIEECSQALNATRTFDLGDLAADVAGLSCAALLTYMIAKRSRVAT